VFQSTGSESISPTQKALSFEIAQKASRVGSEAPAWEAAGMSLIVSRTRGPLRWLASALFIFTGALHFTHPQSFRRIVPPAFPSPTALVAISGVCEIAGGLGLQSRRLRRAAGWGLIALLIAVFPANVYMVINPQQTADSTIPLWMLWARLPLQGVIVAWVWFVALSRR
jgi:uncharacterized membrane protein